EMLSVALGPGLLGMVYDGLQNPLKPLAERDGFFLARGREMPALDHKKRWLFSPIRKRGDKLQAGDVIGTVKENRFTHKIMIPFGESGTVELTSISSGEFTINEPVARIKDTTGRDRDLTLVQRWPVRKPLPEKLLRLGRCERLFPQIPLT